MERRKGIVINDSFPPGITPAGDLCQNISAMVVDTGECVGDIIAYAAHLSQGGKL